MKKNCCYLFFLFFLFPFCLWSYEKKQDENPPCILSKADKNSLLYKPIAGQGCSTQEQMYSFISKRNPQMDKDILSYLIKMYIVEANREGINYDIAFSQMALETNYLKFGNDVDHTQNNFAGLGVVRNGVKGHEFETIYLGIRVHIQHLAAYALETPLKYTLIDPRFKYVKRGSASMINELTGKWATDPQYGVKIAKLLTLLLK